jgi:hypothetical protein
LEKGCRAVFSAPAQGCSASQPNLTCKAARYHFPHCGPCHLGPTCRCPLFPHIPQLSAHVSRAAPIPTAVVLRPIKWSLASLLASNCLAYVRPWVIMSPRSPRHRIALLCRSTTVKAAAPPRCRRQAPGDKASCSVSASSSLAGTACGPV